MPSKTASKTRTRNARAVTNLPAESMPSSPARGVGRSPAAWRLWAACLFLLAATLVLYSPVGNHPFINYDDEYYVVQNAHVTAGLSWDTLSWALTATEQQNWHPLTWLSHAVDCQLFGLNASGHHWTNVAFHALNVLLLFLLLQRATGSRGRSFLVAALFALHPLNVESVAWVAERKNVLSTMFFLLTLGSYGWYAKKPEWKRYGAVAVLFALGLAAKPMVITLPFVLLLLDFWPLCRFKNWTPPSPIFPVPQSTPWRLALEKLPLLAFSAASAVITIVAQGDAVIPTMLLPLSVRLEDAFYAYGMYLWKAFWPVSLALIYPHPGRTLAAWQPALGALIVVGVAFVAWKQRFVRPWLAVGWFWFLGTAVPVIGIVQVGVQVIADRYAYLPLIGVFVMVVWHTAELADHAGLSPLARAVTAGLVLAGLSFLSWRQIGYWESTVAVWTHALQVTTSNSIAEHNLVDTYFLAGQHDEGMIHLRNYARLEPLDPIAHAQVGADLQDHGQLRDAINEYEIAMRAGPDSKTQAVTYVNLAVIYVQLGEFSKGRENAQRALQSDPATIGEMIQQLGPGVAARPTAAGYLRLGLLLSVTGHAAEAQHALALAAALDPRLTDVPQALR